jgi:hypothetical protein
MLNQEGFERKQSWSIVRYRPYTELGKLKDTISNLSQGNQQMAGIKLVNFHMRVRCHIEILI